VCAVIGLIFKSPTSSDFETIRKVFLESSVRGMHATGMSFVRSDDIITVIEPKPADYFVEHHLSDTDLVEMINDDGNLYLVGHCRYSTSDLMYNQPIANESVSVVHNGVISQALPEQWEELYGYKCSGKNDTELLVHSLEAGKSPLEYWKDSSLAVCELHVDRKLRVYRNGKRPLYLTHLENGRLITSTADIPKRAGIESSAVEVPMNTYLTFDRHIGMHVKKVETGMPDLQKVNNVQY